MEWDSEYLYKNNLLYSKELLKLANRIKIPFIYASSASVYGDGSKFEESIENEKRKTEELGNTRNPLRKGTVAYKNDYVSPIKIHQLRKPIMRVGFDLGPLSIDFDLLGASIYSVELIDAFPTTISSIELSNDADGLVEVSVQFSYTNWIVIKDERGLFSPKISLSGGII